MKRLSFNEKDVLKILFLIVLSVGAYLRLSNIDLIEFKSDEARDMFVAKKIFDDGTMPLQGPPSQVGVNFGPIEYYMLALVVWISADPVLSAIFISLINIFALCICYVFGKRFFDEKIGLISLALFIASIWPVLWSRKIWNPCFLPPFTLLFFFSLYKILENKPRYTVLAFLSLAFLFQLHLSTVVFIIPMLVVLISKKSEISKKYFSIGIIAFILLFVPYALFEIGHGFPNTNRFLGILTGHIAGKESNSFSDVMKNVFDISFGSNLEYLLGASKNAFPQIPLLSIKIAYYLEALMFVCGVGFVFLKSFFLVKNKKYKFQVNLKYLLLILWLFIPIIFFSLYRQSIYPHYFILLYPVQYLIIGIFCFELLSLKSKKMFIKLPVVSAIVFIFFSQLFFILNFYSFIELNGGTEGDFTTAFRFKRDAIKFIVSDSSSKNIPVHHDFSCNEEPRPEYKYLFDLYKAHLSEECKNNTHYVIVDTIHDKKFYISETENTSEYSKFDFGPVIVYKALP